MKKIFYILTLLSIISCNGTENSAYVANKKQKISKKELQDKSLEKVNKYLVIRENNEINSFVNRHKWNVIETGSGLRYEIYVNGNGRKVEKGDIVSLDYKLYSITGNLLYSSDSLGPKVFKVGRGGVESGLEEVVLYLHKGDKAHVILPSHLAYGLKGDMNKIPKKSTIIYDLQLTDIK